MVEKSRGWLALAGLLAVLLLVAWLARYEVVRCGESVPACLVLDRWTGTIELREW